MENKLSILFGSQTGTAEDVAERVGRESQRRHIKTTVMALDEYEIGDLLNEMFVVFVVSTAGQGDPPDNMKKFWKFILRRNLPLDSLENLHVAVLGLGDSSYLKYNYIGKKLYRRLCQLGAHPILDLALADEQHPLGLNATIDPWLLSLWNEMLQLSPLPNGLKPIPKEELLPPKFHIKAVSAPLKQEQNMAINGVTNFGRNTPWISNIVSNTRKTSQDHYQDVRYIEFDIEHSNLSYIPGDVLMVQPCNIAEKVDEFFELVQWNRKQWIDVTVSCKDHVIPDNLPRRCSLEQLFTTYLTLQAPPKRYFFELLAHFTSSELEEERLQEFCSAEGQEDLYDYCYKPKRNYIEVLQDFPNACSNLKIEYLFDLFPPMQPRAFSIASSFKMNAKVVGILMAVVKYKTKMFLPRLGVCSSWLATLVNDKTDRVKVWIVKGTIEFPKSTETPVIMVGPGTGVAPFNSFIQERAATKAKGMMVLFFGCRNQNGDDFLRDEWNDYIKQTNLKIFTAYSRDQSEKIYVQHKMKEQGQLIWKLISEEKAFFFIAGNSKDMPNDVISCLKEVIAYHGHLTEEEADCYFKQMEMSRRFQCETWS